MEQKGYVIVEHFRNGKEKCVVQPSFNYELVSPEKGKPKNAVVGISGYGELFYTKSITQKYCDELNELWAYPAFGVKKAKIVTGDNIWKNRRLNMERRLVN